MPRSEDGHKLEIAQRDEENGILVIRHFRIVKGTSLIETWTEVCNEGRSFVEE